MEERRPQKLAAILHADVVGSTALVHKNQAVAHDRIQDAFRRFSETIRAYGGVAHELRGDALVAEFDRASAAVSAALAFQSGNAEHNAALDDEIRPQLRVGIGMGEVVIADNTLTGAGVVLAQRLEQLAEADGVCIQGAAYETIPSQLPFTFESMGEQMVKGFEQPVRAFGVSLTPGQAIPLPERPRKTNRTWLAAASVGLVAIVAGGLVWLQPWVLREEPASVERMAFPLPDKPSIAVLPFENASAEPAQDYLADGVTENIITELSKISGLFVIAHNTTSLYRDESVEIRAVSEDLGVRYVLGGSVRRSGDQVRIAARLIDAMSGRYLWAESYDRSVAGIFEIQDQVTRKVVAELAVTLKADENERLFRSHAQSFEAYDLFLRARKSWEPPTPENLETGKKLFRQVIDLDPAFAGGYAGLSLMHSLRVQFDYSKDPEEDLDQAYELAEKAVAVDDAFGWAHTALGTALLMRREHDQAITEAKAAIRVQPGDADAHSYLGFYLHWAGRGDEAITSVRTAMRLNPQFSHSGRFLVFLGFAQFTAGQYADAVETFEAVIENHGVHGVPGITILAFVAASYSELGRDREARQTIERLLEYQPDASISTLRYLHLYKSQDDRERLQNAVRRAGLPENPPLPLPDKPSIAVLPFANMSGDPEQEYFADGIAEDLTTDLSKISGLFVISRNSAFTYKSKTAKPEEVARELGVRYVVEGSVRRAGKQVRINAQLIDATTGGHLWAERYDGSTSDVFDLQDKVTRKIVTALAVELTEGQLQRTGETQNVDAYDAFMKGWMLYRTDTPQGFVDAIPHFERAVALDPGYGRAYAALATVYYLGYWRNWQKPFDVLPEIREFTNDLGFVTLAFEYLDKSFVNPSPLSYILRAETLLNQPDHEGALRAVQEAVALDPNEPDSYVQLARVLTMMGRAGEAIPLIEKAMRLNPYFPASYLSALGLAYFGLEDFEKAASVSQQAVKLSPYQSPLVLIASYGHLDRGEDALPYIESLREQLQMHLPGYPATVRVLVNWRFPLFQHLDDRQRLIDGLRKAGLP